MMKDEILLEGRQLRRSQTTPKRDDGKPSTHECHEVTTGQVRLSLTVLIRNDDKPSTRPLKLSLSHKDGQTAES